MGLDRTSRERLDALTASLSLGREGMARQVTEGGALEMKRLYVEEGLSQDEVAAKVGCTKPTVRRHLRLLGVQMRSKGSRRGASRRILPGRRHGMSRHPHYRTWMGMMQRCYDPAEPDCKDYSGRGIAVFGPWHDARVYIEYVEAVLGPKPSAEHTINRIDNDGNYEPGNIEWADKKTQARNRGCARNA